MKNYAVLFIAVFFLVCCQNSGQQTVRENRDSLTMEIAFRDSLLNDVFSSINEISYNLEAIKSREGLVSTNIASGEIGLETRAKINDDIAAINDLLERNKATIIRLQGSTEQLRSTNVRLLELERLIDNFTRQVNDKDADIFALQSELDHMKLEVDRLNTTVDSLNTNAGLLTADNRELETKIRMQTEELNTVYYIMGNERELRNADIVEKSGIIGRTTTVNPDADLDRFTRTEKDLLREILIDNRKVEIVTSHPVGSYELVMSDRDTVHKLVIKDPERFWESSRVLVVTFR